MVIDSWGKKKVLRQVAFKKRFIGFGRQVALRNRFIGFVRQVAFKKRFIGFGRYTAFKNRFIAFGRYAAFKNRFIAFGPQDKVVSWLRFRIKFDRKRTTTAIVFISPTFLFAPNIVPLSSCPASFFSDNFCKLEIVFFASLWICLLYLTEF